MTGVHRFPVLFWISAALVTAGAAGPAWSSNSAYPEQQPFFEDWSNGINSSIWQVAGWREHNTQMSPQRVFVEDQVLNVVFINDPQQGYLGGALQTRRNNFTYGRWEARLKPSSVPGVLNSMYTIDWRDGGNQTRQEIDIEFLTYTFGNQYPGEVWLAQHARGRRSNWLSVPLDFNPSEDFHVWGFDITPEYVEYFVDDIVLYRYVYADHDIVFDAPYMLKFNVWTQVNWINGPPPPGVETIYQIDWIRFTPIPEPASLAVAAIGLLVLSARRARPTDDRRHDEVKK